jgi:hypothetical protein
VRISAAARPLVRARDGRVARGGRTIERDVPLDTIPLFGREGHLLPLGPVVQHTGELPAPLTVDEVVAFGTPTVPLELPVVDADGTPATCHARPRADGNGGVAGLAGRPRPGHRTDAHRP